MRFHKCHYLLHYKLKKIDSGSHIPFCLFYFFLNLLFIRKILKTNNINTLNIYNSILKFIL